MNRYPSDKTCLNQVTRQLKTALQVHKNEQFAKYANKLTTSDKSLWNATKRILSYKSSRQPLRQEDGTWAKTDEEISSAFGKYLATIFTPHSNICDPEHSLNINSQLDSPLPLSLPPKAFQPKEVLHCIHSLPPRKSPGYDLITSQILRHFPKKAILFLTYIYNAVLRTTYFPILWKFSVIRMIPKPGKPSHLSTSYRPISLLPIMGKILEKLILKRLYPILEPTIPSPQFGFRQSHSTIHQCHRIVDVISESFENGQYCSGVFLDVAQAFDRVWHQGLLSKLKITLPSTYFLILKSYLSDRYFQVSHGSSSSAPYPQLAGVPQGGILSPLLFLTYTADIPYHPDTSLHMFADDTSILTSNSDPALATQSLQEHLNLLEPWLIKWRIQVNAGKSAHTTFTLRRSSCPPVKLYNTTIPQKSQVRYLGLTLDKRLTWSPHTTLKRQEVNRRYRLLLRLLDKRSKLSLTNKRLLYNSVLQPTWTYGIELWGSTKPSNSRRLQTMQSKILRKITDAPFYVSNLTLHNDLNIPFVQSLIKSRYNKFHSHLPGHPNPLINSLFTQNIPQNSSRRLKRRWPRDLLT